MKKILLVFGLVTFLSIVSSVGYAKASEDMGEYFYWYSDESSMGYWNTNPIKVYCNSTGAGLGGNCIT